MKKIFVFIFLLISANVFSFDFSSIICHVTLIEPTYMPQEIVFQIDAEIPGFGSSGTFWVHYTHTNIENVKAIYSALLLSLISGNRIQIFGDNINGQAYVSHIHLFDS